jgi:hypothetical protein
LDEPNELGYCIDISGAGSSLDCGATQAHSCKPGGQETQFTFDAASGAIKAVNYDGNCGTGGGGCLAVSGSPSAGSELLIATCDGSPGQTFVYSAEGSFVLGEAGALCLAVAEESRAANQYLGTLARDLFLADCDTTGAVYTTWTVVDSAGGVVGGGASVTERAAVLKTEPPVHNCFSREKWSEDKAAWCCEREGLGCVAEAETVPSGALRGAVVPKPEPPTYNCLSRESWSEDKEAWCCEREGLGCEAESGDGAE